MQTRHLLTALLFAASPLLAQQVAPPASDAAPAAAPTTTGTATTAERQLPIQNRESKIENPSDDEVVEMSPFTVTGSQDKGYQSFQTTSGSRIKTDLKDTAASISPFTDELLNDIGATTIDSIISYAGNAETEVEDASSGFNNTQTRMAGNSNNSFRLRGISASLMVDYATYNAPMDMYNLSRAEVASGANSILFGMGSQGGIINFTRNHANASRTKLTIKDTIGTWTSPAVSGIPYERATLDYNLVLKPHILGLRLMALYQDGDNTSWRYWQFAHDRRVSPALYIHPFKNTTINLTFETGRRQDATTRLMNATDEVTGWLIGTPATGPRPIIQNYGMSPNQSIPGVLVNYAAAGIDNYVYVNNTNQIYNYRQAYESTNPWTYGQNQAAGGTGWSSAQNNNVRLPSDLSSYYYSTVGPAGRRDQRFSNWSALIEQTIGKLNLELAYFHGKVDSSAMSDNTTDAMLQGDPNAYISPPDFINATTVIPNPGAGQLYMENTWFINTLKSTNDTIRLTATYDLNLKKYGRHHIIALYEHGQNETRITQKDEILADDNGHAISNPLAPISAAGQNPNLVTTRNYVTPGDFRTYYDGDPRTPITDLDIGGILYHSAWAADNNRLSHIKLASDSLMLALQSYWLKDRLVTTLGARVDSVVLQRERLATISDPNDPRILNGTRVWNEYDFSGAWWPRKTYTPFTLTAGAVYHLSDRLSPYINYSTNRGLPYTDGRTVLPDGDLPPLTKGSSLDTGLMIDILGDNKWTLRLTYFQTKQLGDAAVTPSGVGTATNPAVGATNLFNIFDALYFLTPTGQTATPLQLPNNAWPTQAGIVTGPGAGPMNAAQYAITAPSAQFPNGAPPQYNAAEVDVRSTGFEAEVTANPTKNLTIRLTASYTNRNRENLFNEIFTYYNKNIPQWLKMADPNGNGGYKTDGITPAYTMLVPLQGNSNGIQYTTQNLYQYIIDQLYSVNQVVGGGGNSTTAGGITSLNTSLRSGLDQQLFLNSGMLGARPYKFNLSVRYTLPGNSSILKGFSIGGGVRYQSFNYMPDPARVAQQAATPADVPATSNDPIPQNLGLDESIYTNQSLMIKGNSLLFWDGLLQYKRKILGGRTTMTLQFNISNIFNQSVVTVGRYLDLQNVLTNENDTVWRRVYLNPPRTYRLSVQFDF